MPAGFRRSRALWDETKRLGHTPFTKAKAITCAVLYELQPIRFSKVNWRQMIETARDVIKLIIRGISYLPGIFRFLAKFFLQRKLGCLGVLAYYFAVRWIDQISGAGPIVLIITALVAIFTIGLSDDKDSPEGLSAYSVFNRGFDQLLGSVDAESLLAQHVGMGPGAVLPVGVEEAPRARRQDRAPAPRAQAPDNNNDDNNDTNDGADEPPRNNRARKSGKKARRRNLEQRRDRQRQLEAAMALGMQGNETEQEMIEMQRMIENQIAQANDED